MTEHKLSLTTAILININIMLGSGIFLNTGVLAHRLDLLSPAIYLFVGIVMIPLILCIATLLRLYPKDSFYGFCLQELGPFAAFISTWSYFTGKLGSATIMIHASITLLQSFFPLLASYSPYLLDTIFLATFIGLNMLNTKTSSIIQTAFIILKSIPIISVFIVGSLLFNKAYFMTPTAATMHNFITSLPLVTFAFIGFEAAASLSNKIENAQHNAAKALLISYTIVVSTIVLYQFIFYGACAEHFHLISDFKRAFPALFTLFSPHYAYGMTAIAHTGIALSALGGAYGVLFSNAWNLYALANHGHVPSTLKELNRFGIPYKAVIIEGIICLGYLYSSGGNAIPLQQLGALGCVIAYLLSALALTVYSYTRTNSLAVRVTALLALVSSLLLCATIIHSFLVYGTAAFILFITIVLLGIMSYTIHSR